MAMRIADIMLFRKQNPSFSASLYESYPQKQNLFDIEVYY